MSETPTPAIDANVAAGVPSVPDVMQTVPALVDSVEKETHDTFTLSLAPPEGTELPGFLPGQISMLYAYGVGETPISISGDPDVPGQLVYTIRSVGLATNWLVTRKPGDCIGVRGPFGTSWPVLEARGKDILIMAGGIGLAPLRPAIYHILRNRGDYERLVILYGARSPRDMLYRKELSAWAYLPDTQVLTTVDYGGLSWKGNVGVVTTLFRHLRLQPANATVMICGPEIMMRFVIQELQMRGVESKDLYLTMERNMKCACGFCGHCQLGPYFVCKDGPVFRHDVLEPWMNRQEI
jgi:NAD(P)H-flavin reductase